MTVKHTPGPWEATDRAWPEQVGCCPLVGRPFSIHRVDTHRNVAAATNYQDARLIAAAPDLLEALIMVRDADENCKRDGHDAIPSIARAAIDAAIAKAEGRE